MRPILLKCAVSAVAILFVGHLCLCNNYISFCSQHGWLAPWFTGEAARLWRRGLFRGYPSLSWIVALALLDSNTALSVLITLDFPRPPTLGTYGPGELIPMDSRCRACGFCGAPALFHCLTWIIDPQLSRKLLGWAQCGNKGHRISFLAFAPAFLGALFGCRLLRESDM